MSILRTTCSACLRGFEGLANPPGGQCPQCEEGTLVLGNLVFENSDFVDSIQCNVEMVHDAHQWGDAEDIKRTVCRGRRLDTSIATTHHILLTVKDGEVQIGGISPDLQALIKTCLVWHDAGRDTLLLTVNQPHEGLTGLTLTKVIATHEFHLEDSEVPIGWEPPELGETEDDHGGYAH